MERGACVLVQIQHLASAITHSLAKPPWGARRRDFVIVCGFTTLQVRFHTLLRVVCCSRNCPGGGCVYEFGGGGALHVYKIGARGINVYEIGVGGYLFMKCLYKHFINIS